MNKPTCAECAFAQTSAELSSGFRCFRFPPSVVTVGHTITPIRPHVQDSDWCGEYSPVEPEEIREDIRWRELNQLDEMARFTLSSLPIEAEFLNLEDGETWHALYDHIEEIEEACPGNVAEHIKAGLRIRVPAPKLSPEAEVLLNLLNSETTVDSLVVDGKEDPRFIALEELYQAGEVSRLEISRRGEFASYLYEIKK